MENNCVTLSIEEAMEIHARYLTDFRGALWPDPFVSWAYKNNFRLVEVGNDEK